MTVTQCTVPSWEQIRCWRTRSIWIDGQTPSSLEGLSRNSCGGYSRRRRALPTSTFVLMRESQPQGGMERQRQTDHHSCPRANCALNSVRTGSQNPRPTKITTNEPRKSPESQTKFSYLLHPETGPELQSGRSNEAAKTNLHR